MKHYIKNNQVFAFESDGSQDKYITPDMIEMSKAEVKAHLNPPKTQQEIDEEAFAEWVIKKKADEEAKLRAEYEASK